ncbi:polysaccharide deacetylase family protein [Aquibacillus halophilus]|uniref:Polysaccharide deacetylase family protein n=1 Tax=Aquibacillus halophilus TaxID=930132 RepID=A0A6A8DKX6_9BACI|nr:polysaccharide deacetylase family protein [Aquibacillus halophilus]MRH41892.1 polysaccharide deacetylase family protein [Aquibacillus halophilus]
MMKNIIFALLLLLFLVGCNNAEQPEVQEEEPVEEGVTEEDETEVPDESDTNTGAGTDEENEIPESDDSEAVDEQEIEVVEPTYELTEDWGLKPISEEGNEDVVLLTIDDAPDKRALDMAKTLKELDAEAIFFVNGHFLDTDEEKAILKEIHELGFDIGNHTYSHQRLSEVSVEKQREEIESLSNLIEEIIGEKPKFFRAPNGVNTEFAEQFVKEEGMLLMNWTYGYDYFKPYMDAEKLTTAMVTGEGPEVDVPYSLLKPGANLLMHDRDWTADALGDIVIGLRDKGYEILDPALIKTPE